MSKAEEIKNKLLKQTGKTEETKMIIPATMAGLSDEDIGKTIESYKPQMLQILPKHLTADRVMRIATGLISRTPGLKECTTESLIGALMQCAVLGFEPIQILGQAYFLPFWNNKIKRKEVIFIIGYKGYVELIGRTGKVLDVYAYNVFSNDIFTHRFGLNPKCDHIRKIGDRGEYYCSYAIIKYVNGGFAFDIMDKSEIEKIRMRSPAKDSGFSPWNNADDYYEMTKKTVLRRLMKYQAIAAKYVGCDESIIKPDSFLLNGEIDLDKIEKLDYTETEVIDDKKPEEPSAQTQPQEPPKQESPAKPKTAAELIHEILVLTKSTEKLQKKASDLIDKKGLAGSKALGAKSAEFLEQFLEELKAA
jgi:recombination protein RecT